jgi:hypothetical protein
MSPYLASYLLAILNAGRLVSPPSSFPAKLYTPIAN